MLERKKMILAALATAIATFFIVRGNKVTSFFAGITTAMGAFSVSEWGVVGGLILGVASFILTWVYKERNHQLLKHNLENGESVEAVLDSDDVG
jgi:uncharacterized membrane protein (DUF485 family)